MTEAAIVIIGGGIAGASAAYHLARFGHDVVLVERGEIASEASGINAGSIGAMGWGNEPDLQAHLTMGSLEIFQRLQLDLGYEIEFRRSGALQAIQTEAEYGFARDRMLELRARGYRVELLTTREARSIEPEVSAELLGLSYLPLWAQADPEKATQALASAAVGHGARILTHHEVTDLRPRDDGKYHVETARGAAQAESLILAAGAWCGPLAAMLGLRVPIVPVKGQMWATASLPPRLFHTLLATESAYSWHREARRDPGAPPELTHAGEVRLTRHLYGRQNRRGEILFGGDRRPAGYDKAADPAGIQINHEHAAEVVPMLRGLPIQRTWAGLMPFTLDGAPLIGEIPQQPGLYIVSGLASSGFGRGPMAGKLLADLLHTGHPHPVLAAADPARCVTTLRGGVQAFRPTSGT